MAWLAQWRLDETREPRLIEGLLSFLQAYRASLEECRRVLWLADGLRSHASVIATFLIPTFIHISTVSSKTLSASLMTFQF